MPFKFESLEINEVILIKPQVFLDERGFFLETYKQSEFIENGIKEIFAQDNHSKSKKGVLRGIHYQLEPFAQAKLVKCIKGEIFDVAVDLRKNSQLFKQWIGIKLTEEDKKMLYIPAGFGHGFYTLSNEAEILYKISVEYSYKNNRSIKWNDPEIDIDWPEGGKILSEKDKNAPLLKDADVFE